MPDHSGIAADLAKMVRWNYRQSEPSDSLSHKAYGRREDTVIAKILVAEDNGHSLVTMLHLLKGQGYLTAFATDGDEALRLARAEQPDVVVCKWRLSSSDGRHTAAQLRKDKRLRNTPIIAVFDHGSLQVVGGRTAPLGCAGYVTEPIDPAAFVKVIEQNVSAARRPSRSPVPLRGQRRRSDRIVPT